MKPRINRREFLQIVGLGTASVSFSKPLQAATQSSEKPTGNKPNIILCMTDDQGWGDTGYNDHPHLKTPNLDAMAASGIRFDRFYSAAPVCSPTRGSCLTGRHPYRYGIFFANTGHMPKEEVTLAEALKAQDYSTGHFGKWHLGTLTKTIKDSNRGGKPGTKEHYSPPWENGFDVCFSTEAKVPTWNPMLTPPKSAGDLGKQKSGKPFGTHYWNGPGSIVQDNLQGDDSRVIMDRAIPFMQKAAKEQKPFFTVIWFHTPHLPVVAGPEYRKMYAHRSEDEQHFYGCITAMDEQLGRLRQELRTLGVAENTMLWFCSDNGPEGKTNKGRTQGTTKGLRGRKRSLFEGGVRVPGLLEWPARIKQPRKVDIPCCTSDYFPTAMDVLGFRMQGQPEPMDGVSLLPLIGGKMKSRPVPIAFESRNQVSLTGNRYKIISQDNGKTYMLFDLVKDPGEKNNLAQEMPQILNDLKRKLQTWRVSCKNSLAGNDYKK
jgi:arylsulfatase